MMQEQATVPKTSGNFGGCGIVTPSTTSGRLHPDLNLGEVLEQENDG